MENKAAVQAAVWDYLGRKKLSVAELARRVEIPGATLNRMLRDDPTYQGRADHWAQLARYSDLQLSESEVLAALGFAPRLPTDVPDLDPWQDFVRVLRRLPLSERHRNHLHFQTEVLIRDSQTNSSGAQ